MKGDYSIYDPLYAETIATGQAGWGGAQRLAKEYLWLERLFSHSQVPQTGRVLELGCGEGHFSRLLSQRGYQVHGVDVSARAIEWAQAKALAEGFKIEYSVADLSQAGVLPEQSYDLIVDGNCLHCIIDEDRAVFLANVLQALKPHCLFFVSSLCHCGDTEKEIQMRAGHPYRQIVSKTALENELLSAGFEVLSSREVPSEPASHCTLHALKPSPQKP
ncbi:class I SAM-dependent methyltransferase [bacterium (Candidatus Blackallbacteria) CG17_big_fil_post_rev_8_21_14_2_50_48_46]|uniref:Class I SAM-dependent methyltransferase n=1 Tax=bacterium (Candidatus Blackallbacteria) CG17_big_fil_post_rev_8_21_14_2_50_48_46 TaxID=2014261 RepID=A0A2M7G0P0_9BACT|nr:MAG: SAM-dependent methyltransferase [bacterium (Candidatus Blackallbacteria) CG18_big_fil_WC_8_21_14_2_50_49_26]PIW15278.1 MAG: class I SAM-dependent methyltransferase [bacterium (Candidatus Blackallbacteria) CG17_big_fil_post_rev_8_21_14_2_50_48_46]PIW45213.1 MAG: class I SAM-dependent methyltransferase [bacterium (Candidatus Blackallbacteria) CG13_big_fil_rev_8_21_14_2_50_49_14]